MVEDSCSPDESGCLTAVLRSDRKDVVFFLIRLLTPQEGAGNALAVVVHQNAGISPRKILVEHIGH